MECNRVNLAKVDPLSRLGRATRQFGAMFEAQLPTPSADVNMCMCVLLCCVCVS